MRHLFAGLASAAFITFGLMGGAQAEGLEGAPAPFDKGGVKVALIAYISGGDFFQAYQAGAEAQAKALGIDLRIFPGKQNAAEQREQINQALSRMERS
jgi:simple sugar transport system substrate-binding protein